MRSIPMTTAALLLMLVPAMAADTAVPPYVGVWDCDVATFTFTRDSYDPGDGVLPVLKVERRDDAYHLFFAGDYSIWLSAVTATSMEWLSEASGDSFHCKRIRR